MQLSCGCRYDDGIEDITNIDFVKSVVTAMLRRNLRARPRMKWQVMDMTAMKVHSCCCARQLTGAADLDDQDAACGRRCAADTLNGCRVFCSDRAVVLSRCCISSPRLLEWCSSTDVVPCGPRHSTWRHP